MNDVRSGVAHIHSKGLVHNDIKSMNVMLDENDTAVLIDFDSCRPNGASIGEKPGFVCFAKSSKFSNDVRALKVLERQIRDSVAPEWTMRYKMIWRRWSGTDFEGAHQSRGSDILVREMNAPKWKRRYKFALRRLSGNSYW